MISIWTKYSTRISAAPSDSVEIKLCLIRACLNGSNYAVVRNTHLAASGQEQFSDWLFFMYNSFFCDTTLVALWFWLCEKEKRAVR